MRYAAVTLLFVLLAASAVRAQSPAYDPAQAERARALYRPGSVDFSLPESWGSTRRDQHMTVVGLLQLTILYPLEEGKELTVLYPADKLEESGEERKVVAKVTLSSSDLADYENFKTLKEMIASRQMLASGPPKPPDFVVLLDVFHGDNWRTLVTRGIYHGQPYVSLYRSGLVDRQTAHLDIRIETDGSDPEPFKRAVADFNAVCESLKINGKSRFDTKLDADKLLELLKPDEKK